MLAPLLLDLDDVATSQCVKAVVHFVNFEPDRRTYRTLLSILTESNSDSLSKALDFTASPSKQKYRVATMVVLLLRRYADDERDEYYFDPEPWIQRANQTILAYADAQKRRAKKQKVLKQTHSKSRRTVMKAHMRGAHWNGGRSPTVRGPHTAKKQRKTASR
jgi:hypothetical protein